jgi:tRNA uridine 5-carboxymethylaminomethyl modification enzyme
LRNKGLAINQDGIRRTGFDLLAYPEISLSVLADVWPELWAIDPTIGTQLKIEALYAAPLRRQDADIRAFRRDEALVLPSGLDYAGLPGLSTEVQGKLTQARPATLGAAARISGVTPAALTILLAHVRRSEQRLSA